MAYKIVNRKIKDVINEIEKHNKLIRDKLSKNFSNRYDKKLWAISLYYTLIKLVKNITVILDDDDNNTVGILITIRSCLDAYINIECIFTNYDKHLKAEKEKLEQEKKQIKKINFDLYEFTKSQKIKFINNLEELLPDIERKYLSEKNKRDSIKLLDPLEDFYKFSSEYVHCGHSALMSCHVQTSKNKYQASQIERAPKFIVLYSLSLLLYILWKSILRIYYEICFKSYNHNLKGIIEATKACRNKIHSELRKDI